MAKPTTIDEYIEGAPVEAREKLREIRSILKEIAPNSIEAIKWGSPVFEEGRILFSFAAFKDHLNFMPTRTALDLLREDFSEYKTGRDTIQFPYDRPLPADLIRKIASLRRKQVVEEGARWM